MYIPLPDTIETVAWEGELEPPAVSKGVRGAAPVVTLGRPEVWAAADLEKVVGKPWTPPLRTPPLRTPPQGDAAYWLVRLVCSLRRPARERIVEAEQRVVLQPDRRADAAEVYAHSLYPDRQSVEETRERALKLSPELKIAGLVEGSVAEAAVTLEYKRVFPVIQSYDVGTPHPSWRFKPHAAHPLEGSQYVFAVIAARPADLVIQAAVEVAVTLETRFGPLRFGLPDNARDALAFKIP